MRHMEDQEKNVKRVCQAGVFFLLAILTLASFAQAEIFSGKVVGILDGDTIEVMHGGKPERVRLNGIDCPEKGQAFGNRARQYTSELAFGRVVTVQAMGHDRYGRGGDPP